MPASRLPGVDVPSPLQITKKNKPRQVPNGRSRRANDESSDSGSDQPLTVVKKRKYQSSRSDSDHSKVTPAQSRIAIRDNIVLNRSPDSVTPKASKIPASRRPSGSQIGQTLAPSFLTKFRSLPSSRAVSSRTTYRRHDSRASSDSSGSSVSGPFDDHSTAMSWYQSAESSPLEPPSGRNELESYHSPPGSSNPSSQELSGRILDPYLLVPRISITPESTMLSNGQSNFWVAVEISAQLFHPCDGKLASGTTHTIGHPSFMPVHYCEAGLSRYGFLYDTRVDVLPTAHSTVIDVIDDVVPRTIGPGASLLILACIHLDAPRGPEPGAVRRNSDDLIADLELQLGGIRTEYVQIGVKYSHSAFPALKDDSATVDGISTCQTRLETTATGVINRYNPASAWSPRPNSASNPLFAIVASHWGPARTNDVIERMMSLNSRRTAKGTTTSDPSISRTEDTNRPSPRPGTAPAVQVPQRQASLKRPSTEKVVDPARKIWTEMRQTSTSNRPAFHVSRADRIPAETSLPSVTVNPNSKTEVERRRELIRDTAVRNKRSIGADSLKSLVPSMVDMNLNVKEENIRPHTALRRPDSPLNGRKREGRWSIGSWW
ncbi:hypothetical protein F4779DRAFT_612663 [Xylariaceae sp. FL0662B]|nr:hypothetical protein F4779DRAFT_612663 [Xylariaceae sp. FL0662B]